MRWARIRFSLRGLMLSMALLAAFAAWFKIAYVDRYQRETELVERLGRLGVTVLIMPRAPQWFWNWFGDSVAQGFGNSCNRLANR